MADAKSYYPGAILVIFAAILRRANHKSELARQLLRWLRASVFAGVHTQSGALQLAMHLGNIILECVSSGTIRKFEWIFRQFKE